MPIIIHTGDPEKCVTISYIECPACGDRFDLPTGKYLKSSMLGEKVLVCNKHVELTVGDELQIQEALQKAMKNPRGMVQKDCKFLKKSDNLKDYADSEFSKEKRFGGK
jgi:hypothetical protein